MEFEDVMFDELSLVDWEFDGVVEGCEVCVIVEVVCEMYSDFFGCFE